jgi:hypothetical protein
MPMPITNTRGLGIHEIAELAAHAAKPYARQTLTAVIMTLQRVPAETIAQTLECSRISVWRYVNRWNRQGSEAVTNHQVCSPRRCFET